VIDLKELDRLEKEVLEKLIVKARTDFYTYIKLMAQVVLPEEFVDGIHLRLICRELQDVAESVADKSRDPLRLQIMLAPGSMKSKIASNLFPSWCLGRNPNWCFLAIGSDFEFAVDNFGRPTKDLIDSPQYQAIFPGTRLKKDVQSAGRWDTTQKGRFVARGAGQNIAGRRAHISIVDDAITEQTTDTDRQKINSWYRKGLRTRLLPRGAEIIINTRWFVEDLSGFMLKVDENSNRPWRVIRIPAILDEKASELLKAEVGPEDPRFDVGTSFWPEFWPTKLLLEKKETTPPAEWAALYMQNPILENGNIVKRSDFQQWEEPEPPKCKSVVISIDTALSQKEAANFSAYTVWGVFQKIYTLADNTEIAQDSIVMLSAGRGRWDFTELCNKVGDLNTRYNPDYVLVEETSAGLLLIPELYKRSIPVLPIKPQGDKTSRLQATTPYFQAKRVWVPVGKTWVEEVISEVISFQPRLKNQVDDYTDTVSQVIIWMRDNHKIDNDGFSNRWDEEVTKQRSRSYWGSLMQKRNV
jgi:predicted phage terminase large subunit-like protein